MGATNVAPFLLLFLPPAKSVRHALLGPNGRCPPQLSARSIGRERIVLRDEIDRRTADDTESRQTRDPFRGAQHSTRDADRHRNKARPTSESLARELKQSPHADVVVVRQVVGL